MQRGFVAFICAVVVAAAPLVTPAATEGRWYAGDFHIHTTYSHDSWDPATEDHENEPWVLGHSVANQFMIAASRGLDFIAITDHNVIDAQSDPGYGAGGVVPIDAYENSLRGHAQMLGAAACYGPDGIFTPAVGDECNDWPDKSAVRVTQMGDALRADGGLLQINHPAGNSSNFPDDADWQMGYDVVPDAIEVWNIQSFWQPPAPSSNSIDDAIRFWEGFLNRGHRVAATGGSDNHWVSTTAVQGAGQPTTWVYATGPTQAEILEGVRAGHTFISWQPPSLSGPRLFLTADADGDDEFESMVGDTVPDGTRVRLDVEGVEAEGYTFSGGADCWIELITNRGRQFTTCGSHHGQSIALEPGTRWVRAELWQPVHEGTPVAEACDAEVGSDTTYCRNRLVRTAMTSAIYVG